MIKNSDPLDLWKQETFVSLQEVLKTFLDELRFSPLGVFSTVVNIISKEATHGFLAAAGVKTLSDLSSKKIVEFCVLLVSGLNSVLPSDYPFIVALVFADENSLVRVGVMDRRAIPGSHDLVHGNLVPILRLDNIKNLDQIKTLSLLPTGVQYITDPDDLEKKFKI